MKSAKGRTVSFLRRSPAAVTGAWGGFIILPRGGGVLHVRLTGVLTHERFAELRAGLQARRRDGAEARFVVLDATHLLHLSVAVAMELAEAERRWRQEGAVVLWVGLSPYLANLLLLSGGGARIPLLPDLATALGAVSRMSGLPSSLARERLEAWDIMRH